MAKIAFILPAVAVAYAVYVSLAPAASKIAAQIAALPGIGQ